MIDELDLDPREWTPISYLSGWCDGKLEPIIASRPADPVHRTMRDVGPDYGTMRKRRRVAFVVHEAHVALPEVATLEAAPPLHAIVAQVIDGVPIEELLGRARAKGQLL